MLAASVTSLDRILQGPIGFLDFMILFMSLGLVFDKSKFSKFLKGLLILTTLK